MNRRIVSILVACAWLLPVTSFSTPESSQSGYQNDDHFRPGDDLTRPVNNISIFASSASLLPDSNLLAEDERSFLQGIAGELSNTLSKSQNYAIRIGFWPMVAGGMSSCCSNMRGNINGDVGGVIDIADILYLVDYLFRDGPPAICSIESDVNSHGGTDLADLAYLVAYLFRSGPSPSPCRSE